MVKVHMRQRRQRLNRGSEVLKKKQRPKGGPSPDCGINLKGLPTLTAKLETKRVKRMETCLGVWSFPLEWKRLKMRMVRKTSPSTATWRQYVHGNSLPLPLNGDNKERQFPGNKVQERIFFYPGRIFSKSEQECGTHSWTRQGRLV